MRQGRGTRRPKGAARSGRSTRNPEKRRRTKSRKDTAALPLRMRKHLAALDLHTVKAYLAWCRRNDFEESTDKDYRARYDETQLRRQRRPVERVSLRVIRRPAPLLEATCAGASVQASSSLPGYETVCQAIRNSDSDRAARESLLALLLQVERRGNFIDQEETFGDGAYPCIDALIAINDRRRDWIRRPETWKPRTRNRSRQFSSLARHLFARHPLPVFMDSVWFRNEPGAERWRDWFVHLGAGKSAAGVDSPVPLTRRLVHHFLHAPGDSTVEGALRWGQVHALGGDRRLTEAFLGSRLGRSLEHWEFWETVVRFLVEHPMLDREHVGPIVDYLHHRKFETHESFIPGRGIEHQGPPQPGLTMKGRTPVSLLRQVQRWHRELGRALPARELRFPRSKVEDWLQPVGRNESTCWRIRQLLSGAELIEEGRKMSHCVASYASSCARGTCSIWAMELLTEQGVEKHQTVELNPHGAITECRGKHNRRPSRSELEIVRRWARAAGLTVSRYVRAE